MLIEIKATQSISASMNESVSEIANRKIWAPRYKDKDRAQSTKRKMWAQTKCDKSSKSSQFSN